LGGSPKFHVSYCRFYSVLHNIFNPPKGNKAELLTLVGMYALWHFGLLTSFFTDNLIHSIFNPPQGNKAELLLPTKDAIKRSHWVALLWVFSPFMSLNWTDSPRIASYLHSIFNTP
jgi:hypothetical protein